ncbi:MAG: phytanoyl-CoA dioxygenase family protein [Alphaproteobacteria bacterium]|nr:phytanoyl-CoA dioxygenase family protein [Alphaproteobacteria bacterium]
MAAGLRADQVTAFRRDGFISGVPVFDADRVAALRRAIEALEDAHRGGACRHSLNQYFRVNGHLVIPLLAELARSDDILDAVEGLLGPNLLAWSVELFIKEPGTEKSVSWHQDITYWGMGETDDEVSAWVALSDVSVEAGCMRFMPGSHKGGIVAHEDTFAEDNLLSRGQEIPGVDEAKAVYGALRPGEMSLHHGRCFHASGPNRSLDRRIGLVIRYVTPEVRDQASGRDYAMLVRGRDAARGWINVAGPRGLFAPEDLALYDEVLHEQSKTLAANTNGAVPLYGDGL